MKVIFAECSSERHQEIIRIMSEGGDAAELAEKLGVTKATVQRIVRTSKKLESFPLTLTDGQTSVPVAEARTSRGFLHACKAALTAYSGTFSNLELPTWRIVAGDNAVRLTELNREPA